jgi:hypothetical protein
MPTATFKGLANASGHQMRFHDSEQIQHDGILLGVPALRAVHRCGALRCSLLPLPG